MGTRAFVLFLRRRGEYDFSGGQRKRIQERPFTPD